jgi:hypothetical protein
MRSVISHFFTENYFRNPRQKPGLVLNLVKFRNPNCIARILPTLERFGLHVLIKQGVLTNV